MSARELKLLPCPHCGCAELEVRWVDWAFRVVCDEPAPARFREFLGEGGKGCGSYGPGRDSEYEAIAAWNRRALDPETVEKCAQVADEASSAMREIHARYDGDREQRLRYASRALEAARIRNEIRALATEGGK